jgi:hypothetical protein
MNREEYIDLFHRAEVNLVAFKQVNDCGEELRKMVEMAVEAEREAILAVIGDNQCECRCSEVVRDRGRA